MLFSFKNLQLLFFYIVILLLMSCGSEKKKAVNIPPSAIPNTPIPDGSPPVITQLPKIEQVTIVTSAIALYKKVEIKLDVIADYENPYNQKEISINVKFTSPTNKLFIVPAFWDGVSNWLVRFTPSSVGSWSYSISITDKQGVGSSFNGEFTVANSSSAGWLQTGGEFNPNYSNKYLVYHNGSPFYGVGHADAFVVQRSFNNGTNDTLEHLITNMHEANENYFVWWPFFYFSPVENNYSDFDVRNLQRIDHFLERLEQEELFVILTLWDHSQLRDNNHPWVHGNWFNNNGFSRLVNLNDFFISDTAWLWQRNLYRYIIARYGYSSSIAMWQTISEIDGTNAFEQTDIWHKKVNDYFIENDPYNHPTTASKAGDIIWADGHKVMGVPQVHIYQDFLDSNDQALVTNTAYVIAQYTQAMWESNNKPNWIGEFGVINNVARNENHYPELFHNAIWSALSNGGAFTPAEWNDFFDWGEITTTMKNHLRYFNDFVQPMPLAQWNPSPIEITHNSTVKSWGLLGNEGGLIWVLDTLVEGLYINELREQRTSRNNISIFLPNIKLGRYKVTPFNTWSGEFSLSFIVDCGINNNGCQIDLPDFTSDIAIRLDKLD